MKKILFVALSIIVVALATAQKPPMKKGDEIYKGAKLQEKIKEWSKEENFS